MIYSCLWIDHRHLLSIWAHVFLCQHLCDASCTTTHCYALQHTATHCNIVCETSKISVSQREIGYAYCCIFFTTSAGQAGKCGELSKIIQSTCSHLSACLLASTHVRRVMYDNTLQHTATHCNTASYCNALHYSAPRRRRGAVLQHTATHCNALQHCNTATYYITLLQESGEALYCNTLQCTATHCNTLQRTTLQCSKKAARRGTATSQVPYGVSWNPL